VLPIAAWKWEFGMFQGAFYRAKVEEHLEKKFDRAVLPGMESLFRQHCSQQRRRGANDMAAAIVWVMGLLNAVTDLTSDTAKSNFFDIAERINREVVYSSDPSFETRVTLMWMAAQHGASKRFLKKLQTLFGFSREKVLELGFDL
jgi:hypothetical protein